MKYAPLALALVVALSGCSQLFGSDPPTFRDPLSDYEDFGVKSGRQVAPDVALAAADLDWPDFDGATLRILDHGAFWAFDDAAKRFEELTGARVIQSSAADTGDALAKAIRDQGAPLHDVIYGLDNILLYKAQQEGVVAPYTPVLAPRIAPENVFFQGASPWPATPVDHGYIAVNIDTDELEGVAISTLHDLRRNAGSFVTQDPDHSTPGLGFLLVTIDRFKETGGFTWKSYWADLFVGSDGNASTGDEVLVVRDWSTSYEEHYTNGYNSGSPGARADRPIVNSYSTSPAYEVYQGTYPASQASQVLLDPQGSAYHQIQTMAVLNGTKNLAVAQAWIEFTLTDDFQVLAAPYNAVYPVVPAVSTDDVYGDVDPDIPAVIEMDWEFVGKNLDRWLREWNELCEARNCI